MDQNLLQLSIKKLVEKRCMALKNQCAVIEPKAEVLVLGGLYQPSVIGTQNHWLKKLEMLPDQVFPDEIHETVSPYHRH